LRGRFCIPLSDRVEVGFDLKGCQVGTGFQGQTILREALLVADHNAYHLGALLVMSRMLLSPPIQQ
jgi:hypothetical protein